MSFGINELGMYRKCKSHYVKDESYFTMEDVFECSSCNVKFSNSVTKIGYQSGSGLGQRPGLGSIFF